MSKTVKRRIERVWSRVYVNTVSTSVTGDALHTAEDAKTLIRTMIQLKAFITGDIATPVRGEVVIGIAPADRDWETVLLI